MLGFWEEIWQYSTVEFLLTDLSSLEQLFSRRIECAMEKGEESGCFGGKDLPVGVFDGCVDGNAIVDGFDGSHIFDF